MHTVWIKQGGQLNSCPLCIDDQADLPLDKKHECPLPCAKHGDPEIIEPENLDALEIYAHMSPGSHIYLDFIEGQHTKKKAFLNLTIIESLCRAYECNFLDTLEKLEIIHQELYHE